MNLKYHDGVPDRRRVDRATPGADTFVSPVDREAIFRELIRGEIRRGRLHKTARARIVGYATGMGLSARQAGELIECCLRETTARPSPLTQTRDLRLVANGTQSHRVTCILTGALIMLTIAIIGILRAG